VPQPELAVGQVWKHKGSSWRKVEILEVSAGENWRDGCVRVYVRRNTSRRRQPISETTLRKEYVLAIVDARVAH
jgi:hypothetical protein